MKNILVTIDFNGKEKLLLEKAHDLAVAFNSKLWIMHIAAPDPDFVGYSVGPQEVRDDRAEDLRTEHRLLQQYSDEMIERGLDAEGLLVEGATIETILNEADKLHADIIISGHENHGFFYRAVIGSTAEQLIEKSKIPVLIVPLK
ncbi:universal stress protein [Formosa sp. PL04]|uniref:universal stress protein n=1 Tax=Formosa sp. PL04 TaxID=3081755 RepID=UPI002981FD63|nr:universal stress protein [Formosa sp. PL04]MDW5290402.1 universal stress protein [Formosa sp. PL04]